MLESLIGFEEHVKNIVERVVLLSPMTWLDNLPGPSFTDPIMQQVRDLKPPFVGGNDWIERRKPICDDYPSNEELCAHPFMSKSLDGENPISVQEWEFLQQNSEAKRFQKRIKREEHEVKG